MIPDAPDLKVIYLGVGDMRQAKILRLLAAGHDVMACNGLAEKTRFVREAGAMRPHPVVSAAVRRSGSR